MQRTNLSTAPVCLQVRIHVNGAPCGVVEVGPTMTLADMRLRVQQELDADQLPAGSLTLGWFFTLNGVRISSVQVGSMSVLTYHSTSHNGG